MFDTYTIRMIWLLCGEEIATMC